MYTLKQRPIDETGGVIRLNKEGNFYYVEITNQSTHFREAMLLHGTTSKRFAEKVFKQVLSANQFIDNPYVPQRRATR